MRWLGMTHSALRCFGVAMSRTENVHTFVTNYSIKVSSVNSSFLKYYSKSTFVSLLFIITSSEETNGISLKMHYD